MTARVCSVMVSYNPGEKIIAVAEGVLPQVEKLIIVDNASREDQRQILYGLRDRHPDKVHLILNAQNRWLANALNDGIRYAMEQGYDYVLEMNDDTFLSPHAVEEMVAVFANHPEMKIGMIKPRAVIGREPIEELENKTIIDFPLAATAGVIVPTQVFREVGLHDEDLVIDFVDFEYGLRLHRAGYRIVALMSVSIAGELGHPKQGQFFGRTVTYHNYSPMRRYYYARDGLALVLRTRDKELRRYYFGNLPRELVKVLLYEDQKLAKYRMTARGLYHALTGRMGVYQR